MRTNPIRLRCRPHLRVLQAVCVYYTRVNASSAKSMEEPGAVNIHRPGNQIDLFHNLLMRGLQLELRS